MRLILYIVVFYLAYSMLIKPLLKMLLKQYIEKELGKFQRGRNYQTTENRRPEGSIKVDYIPENKTPSKKSTENDGEYIDYEEVK